MSDVEPKRFRSRIGHRQYGVHDGRLRWVSPFSRAPQPCRRNQALAAGATMQAALTDGYHVAFMLGAGCAGVAAIVGGGFLRTRMPASGADHSAGASAAVAAND